LLLDLAPPHAVSFSGGFSNAGRLSLWLAPRMWLAGIRKPQHKRSFVDGRAVRHKIVRQPTEKEL
jgi:hypothetical protein